MEEEVLKERSKLQIALKEREKNLKEEEETAKKKSEEFKNKKLKEGERK